MPESVVDAQAQYVTTSGCRPPQQTFAWRMRAHYREVVGADFIFFPTKMISLLCLAGGCASIDTVKEARGQGDSRTYPYAYEQVFNAALAAAKTKGLDVLDSDKTGGRLALSHGVTWLSWGERIAVFF